MRISLDNENKNIYIILDTQNKCSDLTTKPLGDSGNILVDYNIDGEVIGIEIIDIENIAIEIH